MIISNSQIDDPLPVINLLKFLVWFGIGVFFISLVLLIFAMISFMMVSPCTDFYTYACREWSRTKREAEISVLAKKEMDILKEVVASYSQKPFNEAEGKAYEFFQSCINLDELRYHGMNPLKRFLHSLGGWPIATGESSHLKRIDDVIKIMAKIDSYGLPNGIFHYEVSSDNHFNKTPIIKISTFIYSVTKLFADRLHRRTSHDAEYTDVLKEVVQQISDRSRQVIEEDAKQILNYEKNIQKYKKNAETFTGIELRASLAIISRMTKFNWTFYIKEAIGNAVNISGNTEVILTDIEHLKPLCKELQTSDLRIAVNYILWTAVKLLLPHTGFALKQDVIQILQDIQPFRNQWTLPFSSNHKEARKLFCAKSASIYMPYAVTKTYFKKNENVLKSDLNMVKMLAESIRLAFINMVSRATWMNQSSNIAIQNKIRSMKFHYGYPKWIENATLLNNHYEKAKISKIYFDNVLLLLQTEWTEWIETLQVEKPKIWYLPPLSINAYYYPVENEIIIPLGIFSVGQFETPTPMALKYSTIGFIIGHEMMHGFETLGLKFDNEGYLKRWLDNETLRAYYKGFNCYVKQYNEFCETFTTGMFYKTTECVKGNKTLNENFADNLGLKHTYFAYKTWLKNHQDNIQSFPGYNESQIFFMGYAFLWCAMSNQEIFHWTVNGDSHSPQKYRVNGALQNFPEFSKAFECDEDDNMNPKNKCIMW